MHWSSRRFRTVVPIVLLSFVTVLACDDKPTGSEVPDLTGVYELVSISFQGQAQMEPPVATGTFTLTMTTYEVDIVIDLPAPLGQTIQDEGTYSLNGNNWSQESSTTGFQSVGTYSFDGTTLEVNATTQGQTVATVWTKLP